MVDDDDSLEVVRLTGIGVEHGGESRVFHSLSPRTQAFPSFAIPFWLTSLKTFLLHGRALGPRTP